MAGNTPGDNDDPFAYLYRSETAAPAGQQPVNQPTQQFPAFGAEPDTYASAPTQAYAPQQGRTAQAPQQVTAHAEYAPPPGGRHGAPAPAGRGGWQQDQRRIGPLGAVAVVAVLVMVAGLGVWAMFGAGGDGDKTGGLAAAPQQSAAPEPTASSSPTAASFEDLTATDDKLQLAGGAKLATDHKGYTGAGFVAGLENQGSAVGWNVEVPKAGRYRLTVRYSNALGVDGQQIERRIGLAANGKSFGQIRMPVIGSWDSWGTTWRNIRLREGQNQILIACGPQDSCHVNIDTLRLTKGG